jgi:hypothetical protein
MRGEEIRLNLAVQIITEECCSCGVVFGLTDYFQRERRRDHINFYCPNGHPQHYTSESDAEKNARLLREEQERHRRTLARENEAARQRDEAEAALKRHQKRTKNGVCPCCKRSFVKLAAHMKTKHPGYAT